MKSQIENAWFPGSRRAWPWTVAVVLASAGALRAQLTISLSNLSFPQGRGETFDVFVANSGPARSDITGLVFDVQSGVFDGSSFSPGPKITSVDATSEGDLLFASNNSPAVTGLGSVDPQQQLFDRQVQTLADSTVTIPGGTPGAPSLTKLATVTLDTTGLSPGSYPLTLNTVNFQTEFVINTGTGTLVPTLTDGVITVVPEPSSALAVGVLMLAIAGWRFVQFAKSL
jgi:hypothetical protein